MKTLKQILAVAAVATLGIGTTFAAPGETGKTTKKVTTKNVAYAKEKTSIGKLATSVAYQEARIEALELQLKADKKADNEVAVASDRQNLRKAEADLKHQKAYLKADEKALKQKHCAAIKDHKKELREDRAELRKTKRQLKRDIRHENEAAILSGASAFVSKHREVASDETALENQRENMKTDLAWVDQVTDDEYENNRVAVRQAKADAESEQADMAYEGARWLIVTDND